MEWQHPQWLYLILPLALAWLALSVYSRRKRRRAAAAFVAQPLWTRILPTDSPGRFWVKLLLRETALVTGLIALAGPHFGTQYEEVVPRGSDLYVLIDVSRSMLAQDVPPSRLGRAKADVAALVNRLEGERVGLIAFAGAAVVKCPLTVDYDAFRRSLDELDPDSAPRGGTAIGDAIRKAIEVYQARADRDQAILLITDGDDQQSYPLEAAAVAAERHATIFTVGLGDTDHGARIPQGAESKSFVEYKGQQVWSKLDGSLLKEIALKTSGVYVPVGTRTYDLGELYAKYLQGRRSGQEQSHKRIRTADQFQVFLALALLALLADALIRPYASGAESPEQGPHASSTARRRPGSRGEELGALQTEGSIRTSRSFFLRVPPPLAPSYQGGDSRRDKSQGNLVALPRQLFDSARSAGVDRKGSIPVWAVFVLSASLTRTSRADNPKETVNESRKFSSPAEAVRQGLQLYGSGDFDKARDSFAAAREQFDRSDAAQAAIAAFDQACASHRKGDVAGARESYLKAGLAHDKGLAASAHYNLGTLSGEEARRLAGEHPETVAPEKRQEIVDQLKAAVASFRHCLELQPDNTHARRDIELMRQWIKYYSDRWQSLDREKRRKETNLVAFLDFLIETERALRESVKALPATAPADAFAEPKRLQDELREEIGPLKDKIKTELAPQQPGAAGAQQPQANPDELEKGIALLQEWANAAGQKMASAAAHLSDRQAVPAAADQQAAIDELEKIWDAVIPFRPLLARDLAEQTAIARILAPESSSDSSSESREPAAKNDPHTDKNKPQSKPAAPNSGQTALGSESEAIAPLIEMQERTLRRTQLLKLKAEAELERVEKLPPQAAQPNGQPPAAGKGNAPDANAAAAKPVDPKELKAGFQKAIELAPRAAEQMDRAAKALKQKKPQSAYPPAEEARKILEEIQKAQPKNDQQDQKQQDQDQKKNEDQQKKDQQKDQQRKDQEKKDQQKKDQDKQDQQKKDQDKKKQEESTKSDEEKRDQKQEQQVSRDRIEEALRKVRERQQEKRERDRMTKARVFGAVPVEKDW
jgi:Ca-activated chloride channel family protein